jgi:hypothetical protein
VKIHQEELKRTSAIRMGWKRQREADSQSDISVSKILFPFAVKRETAENRRTFGFVPMLCRRNLLSFFHFWSHYCVSCLSSGCCVMFYQRSMPHQVSMDDRGGEMPTNRFNAHILIDKNIEPKVRTFVLLYFAF